MGLWHQQPTLRASWLCLNTPSLGECDFHQMYNTTRTVTHCKSKITTQAGGSGGRAYPGKAYARSKPRKRNSIRILRHSWLLLRAWQPSWEIKQEDGVKFLHRVMIMLEAFYSHDQRTSATRRQDNIGQELGKSWARAGQERGKSAKHSARARHGLGMG